MPRYFFHTDDLPDTDGCDLESLAVAKCEAVKMAGTIICESSGTFWDSAEWSMTVADEAGLTLFQLLIRGTDTPAIRAENASPVLRSPTEPTQGTESGAIGFSHMQFDPAKCAVLIVEDEPLIRMVAADVLEGEGVPYLEAGDADEALDKLAHHPEIAVSFTDINMPGNMDGVALATAVHERDSQVELIITSGRRIYSDAELPDSGTFLAKPYKISALVDAVRAKLASFTRRRTAGR